VPEHPTQPFQAQNQIFKRALCISFKGAFPQRAISDLTLLVGLDGFHSVWRFFLTKDEKHTGDKVQG
jgi:hypothetical protein